MITRSLAENLDVLFAGRDTDSGIRDPELLQSCIETLKDQADELAKAHPHRLTFLDVVWDLAVELYGSAPYSAEDRLTFIRWLRVEAGT